MFDLYFQTLLGKIVSYLFPTSWNISGTSVVGCFVFFFPIASFRGSGYICWRLRKDVKCLVANTLWEQVNKGLGFCAVATKAKWKIACKLHWNTLNIYKCFPSSIIVLEPMKLEELFHVLSQPTACINSSHMVRFFSALHREEVAQVHQPPSPSSEFTVSTLLLVSFK